MKNLNRILLLLVTLTITVFACGFASASDHDDGETDIKGRNLNLTDVYAFREDKEVAGGSAAHLVFLINTNPRSLPQQQYFFSTTAYYDLHVSRVGTSKDVPATTADNVILRVQFGIPNTSNQQAITVTTIIDGTSTAVSSPDAGGQMLTTPLTGAASPVVSTFTVNGQVLSVFGGLRKDPFFFDVTSFFSFRAAAAATGGMTNPTGFSSFPGVYTPNGVTASDFTARYNVNTIALRVPIAFLQKSSETVFDTWATVSIPQP